MSFFRKRTKKSVFVALLLVMMMMLSAVPAFALNEPTSSTQLLKPSEVNSVTISGVAADYWEDDNGSTKFIRAELSPGSTEHDLKHTTVVVNLVSTGTTVSSPELTFSGVGTATRTATNVDLLNKVYSVTIGSTNYTLAAGLPTGSVDISVYDPLAVDVTFTGQSLSADAYGFNVQNPYMGNPYYTTTGWTFINYFISDELSSAPLNRADVGATVSTSATITGDATQVSGSSYKFNLSQAVPNITATSGSENRVYRLFVSAPGDVEVDFGIDVSEAIAYGGTAQSIAEVIQADIRDYLGTAPFTGDTHAVISVPSGTTAMDLIEWFTNDRNYTDKTNGASYISSINGLAEFTGGPLSGWMYTDVPYTPTCSTPWVGAADYVLTADGTITWFYTTNYFNHF